jgi:hypothetical protein
MATPSEERALASGGAAVKSSALVTQQAYRGAVTPEEDKYIRHLGQALEKVTNWENTVMGSASEAWKASPGSELATDDQVAHPYTVSSASWSAITAAVSHLGTLRDSLFRETSPGVFRVQLHTHGQLTLVRGALENASLAYWLLESDQSEERITRRLQEDWEEARQLDVVRAETGQPSGKTMADRRSEMTDVLTRAGCDPARLRERPGYGEIVKLAGAHQPTGAQSAFVIWKMCSSIAHGELRGLLAYLPKTTLDSPSPGMQLTEATGNVGLMTLGGLIAIGTTDEALKLYKRRAHTQVQNSDSAETA